VFYSVTLWFGDVVGQLRGNEEEHIQDPVVHWKEGGRDGGRDGGREGR